MPRCRGIRGGGRRAAAIWKHLYPHPAPPDQVRVRDPPLKGEGGRGSPFATNSIHTSRTSLILCVLPAQGTRIMSRMNGAGAGAEPAVDRKAAG